MIHFLEKLTVQIWNAANTRRPKIHDPTGLDLGREVVDDVVTDRRVTVPQGKRCEHFSILGKTGQGKSRLLHHIAVQDIQHDRGFVYFDLHGDSTPFLLSVIAQEERRRGIDLSEKLIVIEPADREYAVGINFLERHPGQDIHVQLAEFAQILKKRWQLESFGARTEELLRNSLHVLGDSGLTIVDLTSLLTNAEFRAGCLARTQNPEIVSYFSNRYDVQSDAMQSSMRDPILNKVTGFIVDEKFRHILGQQHSSFSLSEAIDGGYFTILQLDKGRLGEQAGTFAGLFLARIKNALFARRSRQLCTLYCDEVQNLVHDTGLDTLLSEARKFGVSVITANQYTSQYPESMRAAIAAVGTHAFFQLSSQDADKVAQTLDGGKRTAELLRNLPPRNILVKCGSDRLRQVAVPTVNEPKTAWTDLYNRSRQRFARRKVDVETSIRRRQPQTDRPTREVLHGWE